MDISIQWKNLKGFENYMISNNGDIKNITTNQILKPILVHKYLYVSPCKDGKNVRLSVHREVGKHFIENPYNLPEIDHIDNNPINNKVDNLRWISHANNSRRQKKNVGASISIRRIGSDRKTKTECVIIGWYENGKQYKKYFKISDYLEAEQFYLIKCSDFQYYF